MKMLSTVLLIALLAGTASAQFDGENMMGIFFSPTEFTHETTNYDTNGAPFGAYLVLINCTVDFVGGYECAIMFSDPGVFVLGAVGENGWTNFGTFTNQLVGYQEPLPAMLPGTVLVSLTLLYGGIDRVEIHLGPSTPPSIPGSMAITDGENADDIIPCPCVTDDCMVATLNGEGVVATEVATWTGVKSLFD